MNNYLENTYWIAIAHLPKWTIERINQLIIQVIHENKITWDNFFGLINSEMRKLFAYTEKELSDLDYAKSDLPRIAFIAEQLQNEGFKVIPINSSDYPNVLKENLKVKNSPVVLYVKGRLGLLQEDAVAIVGARNAGKDALDFTAHVARKVVKENKVVVSGFAKGIDKQALDSTLEANGKSIMVIPQGILTFQSGFKNYYQPIVKGDVMVLSAFFPKAGWDVGFAMARNTYIYGLAKEIYVAESERKGGTWEGAMNGLKRHRMIYVREPGPNEKNANKALIEFGGIPVNLEGEPVKHSIETSKDLFIEKIEPAIVNEPQSGYSDDASNIETKIFDLLKKGNYSSREILLALKLDWDRRKLTNFLKNNPNVTLIKGKPAKYSLSTTINLSLFNP